MLIERERREPLNSLKWFCILESLRGRRGAIPLSVGNQMALHVWNGLSFGQEGIKVTARVTVGVTPRLLNHMSTGT